jgi:hypothetical protein
VDEERDDSAKTLGKQAFDAAITAITSGAIQSYAGTGLAVSAFTGALSAIVPHVLEKAIQHRQRNEDWTIEIALRTFPEGVDIFKERLSSNVDRIELFARILKSAAPTTLDAKVIALGRVLAYGLEEDANMGEAFMLAAALADMEGPHILVLQRIHEQTVAPEETRTNQERGWDKNDIAQAMPEFDTTLDGILATLSRHGLLMDVGRVNYPGSVGPTIWTISPLGRRAMFLLNHEVELFLRQMQEEV